MFVIAYNSDYIFRIDFLELVKTYELLKGSWMQNA